MDTTKRIRIFAFIEILLLILYLIASFQLESSLPPSLQEYLSNDANKDMPWYRVVALIIAIPWLFIHVISLIGLILVRKWAKNLFLFGTGALYILVPFSGHYVDHALAATLDSLSILVMGILVALLLYTESSLNKQKQQRPEAGTH